MPEISDRLAAALRHHQAGNTREAESIYQEILANEPDNFLAWHLAGTLALQSGQHALAEERLRRSLVINPSFTEAHNNLGVVLRSQGHLDQAIACYQKVVQLAPHHAEAHFNLGNALKDLGQLDEAVAAYRRALSLRPNYVEALGNCGCALRDQGNLEESLALHQRAADLAPHSAQAQFLLGSNLHESGQFDLARDHYRRALELKPDYPEAHLNHSAIRLITGDFEHGWQEYESRWVSGQMPDRGFSQPVWTGEPLKRRTILLHAEQGIGDTLQFIRYAPRVKRLQANVIVECSRNLIPLLTKCPGIDRLVAFGEALPSFDVHAALLSLPRILKTTLATVPANVPYLFATSGLIANWRTKLAHLPGFRIGVNWRGREGKGEYRKRDIPLEQLAKLARLPGVRLINLQRNAQPNELAALNGPQGPSSLPTSDLSDEVDVASGAFMDTAAIMMNLDLVITSDTAIPHLAGALGIPVWLALPFAPDWRWLLKRNDCPWYPTMRLFRQQSPDDWPGVFVQIEQQLRTRLLARGNGR